MRMGGSKYNLLKYSALCCFFKQLYAYNVIIFSLSPSVSGPQLLLKKEMFMRSCWINRKSRHALILSTVRTSLCLLYTHSHLNTVMCRRCFCLCVRWAFMGIRSKHLLNQIMQHSYTVNQNNIKVKKDLLTVFIFPVSSPGSYKAGESCCVEPGSSCSAGCA